MNTKQSRIPLARRKNFDEAIEARKNRKKKTVCQKKGHHSYLENSRSDVLRFLSCRFCGNKTQVKIK